jgi:hypothetical protein
VRAREASELLREYAELEDTPESLFAEAELDEEALDSFDWDTYNQKADKPMETDPKVIRAQTEQIERSLDSGQVALTTVSNMVEKFLTVDRHDFSFKGRAYLKGLYDPVKEYPTGSRNQIWMAGRQVEKSTSQAGKSIALGLIMPSHKCLYIAPRFDQVRVFSQQRFRTMCEDSPKLAGTWIKPSRTLWQVSSREFLNGSFFNFRSCYLSADNSRGITAHTLLIDEIQDILSDAIPVLEQCQSHAEKHLRFNAYAGTAKTTGNVISRRWDNSCQFEWLVKCQKCNHWNYSGDEIVGDKFYMCTKCHREIYPHRDGKWIPARPELLDVCWGFRVSQLMVPFKSWQDIYDTREDPNNTRQKYFNECLGLPYDEGEVVLTKRIVREACNEDPMWTIEKIRALADKQVPFFGGVDYGMGEGVNPAYTVLSIGFRNVHNQFQVVWMRKLKGEEANLAQQPNIINTYFSRAGVRWMGNDWGFGAHNNARLVQEFDWHRYSANRLMLEYQYVKQKVEASWNDQAQRYMIDRNQSMGKMIDEVRKKNLIFFRREDMEIFMNDFISIFIDYNDRAGTYKYDHTMPDDAFHSVNYALLAMRQFYGMLVPTGIPKLD